MQQPILIVDANFLCHRAFHSTRGLSDGLTGVDTGTIYGFLMSLKPLVDRFAADRIVFCFDHGKGRRKELNNEYKANRKQDHVWNPKPVALRNDEITESDLSKLSEAAAQPTPPAPKHAVKPGKMGLSPPPTKQEDFDKIVQEAHCRQEMLDQVELLKKRILVDMKFANIFYVNGLEADDLIASAVNHWKGVTGSHAYIVSADKDLYQLLSPTCSFFSPKAGGSLYTDKDFRRDWNIEPSRWAEVKAISGCSTDNVIGVDGVGEITAAKYIRGELKESSAAYKAIEASKELIAHNRKLVQLPFAGTPVIIPYAETSTKDAWDITVKDLAMPSLLAMYPFAKVRGGIDALVMKGKRK